MLIRLRLGRNLHIQQLLPHTTSLVMQCWDSINGIHRQREPVSLVADGKLKRGIDVALLLVASDVEIELAGSLVGETVDEPWIGMEVEDNGTVLREY